MKTKILSGLICCLGIFSASAQTITAPIGQPLTITNAVDVTLAGGNVNVPADGSFNIGTKKALSTKGLLNLFVGENTGNVNTGDHNVFIGAAAGQSNTSGIYNLFLGGSAGSANTTGTQNIFMGGQAGFNNTIGYDNVFIGLNSGLSNTTGHSNLFMGTGSGGSNSTGIFNTFIGKAAGGSNTTGTQNTFIGGQAGYNNTIGYDNFFIGLNAGYSNLGGHHNLFIGNSAGGSNTTGIYNTFIGPSAGGATTTGTQNTFIGGQAGNSNTTGQNNLFMGLNSGYNNLTGSDNVFLGNSAGGSNTSGSSNTFIGSSAGATGVLTNVSAIGSGATATASNTVVLGQAATTITGTGLASGSGLRFANLNVGSAGAISSTRALGLDGAGNVILVAIPSTSPSVASFDEELKSNNTSTPKSEEINAINDKIATLSKEKNTWTGLDGYLYNNSTNGVVIKGTGLDGNSLIVKGGVLSKEVNVKVEGSESWPDYVFQPSYKRMSLDEVEKFITVNKHLPNVPSAAEMAITGNNLGKTDVKLLEKVEELTLYLLEMKKANDAQSAELKALKQQVNSLKRNRK